MQARSVIVPASLGLALLLAAPARAFDPALHADERVIQVVTTNPDGSSRTTKVWIVVVDDQAYIRTGATTWGGNVERDPDVRILTDSGEFDLRAVFVTDEAERDRVTQAFRDKYGWSDRLLSPFRGDHPRIMRLVERTGGG
jgi:hypothetical protein